MSRGTKLQKMEEDVKQSKTAVNANAKPAEPMGKVSNPPPGTLPIEDLGGPTPDNYSPTNDSAKLKDAAGTLKQVSDVVTNRNPKGLGSMAMEKDKKGIAAGDEVELEADQEIVSEEPATEEVVAEDQVEETVEAVEEYDMEEDVNALLGGEELSEDFRAKAKTIFEAAINSKASVIREQIQAEYDEKLSGHVDEFKEGLLEREDSYLSLIHI